jgi:hypothetical protein
MDRGWYVEVNDKIVGRSRIPFVSTFLNWLGFGRIPMTDLYVMVRDAYHEDVENTIVFSEPFERDSFPKPDAYPRYHRLQNGWQIEKGSISFIKNGPLFAEDRKALVPATVFVQSFWQRGWRFLVGIGAILGIIRSVLWAFGVT